jgi:hypothetical protein
MLRVRDTPQRPVLESETLAGQNASNQVIEVDLSVFSRFRFPAMIAFVVFAKQLIGVSHGLQCCSVAESESSSSPSSGKIWSGVYHS